MRSGIKGQTFRTKLYPSQRVQTNKQPPLSWLMKLLWRWRQEIPLKVSSLLPNLHGVTSRKAVIFTVTSKLEIVLVRRHSHPLISLCKLRNIKRSICQLSRWWSRVLTFCTQCQDPPPPPKKSSKKPTFANYRLTFHPRMKVNLKYIYINISEIRSSGIWRCTADWNVSDVSNYHSFFIFKGLSIFGQYCFKGGRGGFWEYSRNNFLRVGLIDT